MGELTEENLRGLTFDVVEKDVFTFEGEDYRNKKQSTAVDPDQQWIELPKRERRMVNADLHMHGLGSSLRDSPPWQPAERKKKLFEKKALVIHQSLIVNT